MYQWCGFKSRRGKNKNLTALKSNSNTVWFNFQTCIYIYISNGHIIYIIYIYIYITVICDGKGSYWTQLWKRTIHGQLEHSYRIWLSLWYLHTLLDKKTCPVVSEEIYGSHIGRTCLKKIVKNGQSKHFYPWLTTICPVVSNDVSKVCIFIFSKVSESWLAD